MPLSGLGSFCNGPMDLPHRRLDPPPSLPSSLGILLIILLKIIKGKGVFGKNGENGDDGEDAWHLKAKRCSMKYRLHTE